MDRILKILIFGKMAAILVSFLGQNSQNLCKIWKNLMRQFWAIYKKVDFFPTAPPTFAPFCPFFREKGIFPQKWQHLKRLMVFYLYAKNYKKRLNGSKDIYSNLKNRAIWLVESFRSKISKIRIFLDTGFLQKVSQP